MHECGGLQRVIRTFVAKIMLSDAAKLSVDDRHQLIQRFAVASAQITEDRGCFRLPQRLIRSALPADIHQPPHERKNGGTMIRVRNGSFKSVPRRNTCPSPKSHRSKIWVRRRGSSSTRTTPRLSKVGRN